MLDEPYEWEESNHIYKDTAIQLGLYRKKVGDPVKIDNNDYVIDEILTLDCFLFRLSMQKIVDAGKAKCIYTLVDDEGQIRLESYYDERREMQVLTASPVAYFGSFVITFGLGYAVLLRYMLEVKP